MGAYLNMCLQSGSVVYQVKGEVILTGMLEKVHVCEKEYRETICQTFMNTHTDGQLKILLWL